MSVDTVEPKAQPAAADLPPETLAFAQKVFEAARRGETAMLDAYIDAGLPPNLTNAQGNSLLMLAAYNGHAETVRLLRAKGADPNRLNDNGQSPLAGAIFKNEEEVVRALVDCGADPRLGSPTAIDTAKVFQKTDWLNLLGATEEEKNSPSPAFSAGPPTSR